MSKLQKQFNDEHREPVPYGEDGDFYALADDFSSDDAINEFNRYWEETCGEDEPKPDLNVGGGYFKKTADGWLLDVAASDGDARGVILSFL